MRSIIFFQTFALLLLLLLLLLLPTASLLTCTCMGSPTMSSSSSSSSSSCSSHSPSSSLRRPFGSDLVSRRGVAARPPVQSCRRQRRGWREWTRWLLPAGTSWSEDQDDQRRNCCWRAADWRGRRKRRRGAWPWSKEHHEIWKQKKNKREIVQHKISQIQQNLT